MKTPGLDCDTFTRVDVVYLEADSCLFYFFLRLDQTILEIIWIDQEYLPNPLFGILDSARFAKRATIHLPFYSLLHPLQHQVRPSRKLALLSLVKSAYTRLSSKNQRQALFDKSGTMLRQHRSVTASRSRFERIVFKSYRTADHVQMTQRLVSGTTVFER